MWWTGGNERGREGEWKWATGELCITAVDEQNQSMYIWSLCNCRSSDQIEIEIY